MSNEEFPVAEPAQAAVPAAHATESQADTPVEVEQPQVFDADGNPVGPPKKKRRRGNRGGKNRKKRPVGDGLASDATDLFDDEEDGDEDGASDYSDARADRGFTSDDVAADAKVEAGLAAAEPGVVAKPKIGDTRPGPAPTSSASVPPPPPRAKPVTDASAGPATSDPTDPEASKKKRRRRGGRGRSKSGAVGANNDAQNGSQNGATNGRQGSSAQIVGGAKHAPGYIEGTLDNDEEAFDLDQLDEKTLARRRGQTRKGRPTGRYQMVVRVEDSGRSHVGVLEGRNLVEHYVSEPADDVWQIDGNIYLGKVQNVLPGMEAAFVDIGTPKNGVLYRGDVAYDKPDDDDGSNQPKIESVLRNGQSILVQVTKNPIAHKGARLTQEVSLAGRFVVMVPDQPGTYGISKRLPDDERKRLRRVLDKVRPSDAGLIVRTAAEGAAEEELERDLRRLKAQWDQIAALAKSAKPGTLLYKEPPLAIRVIREEFTKEYRSICIDNKEMYEDVKAYIDAVSPELAERVEYHDREVEPLSIFEKFHVHEQLYKALEPKVWLPSGGSVVIERTEALTVIDVNTGKNVGRSNLEETVFKNNLEAAQVIARELRLRDIGGIIVIDFIDMEPKANRDAVEKSFREALARDKTRTQVFPISELGLLEMTRKRVSEGLVESFAQTCETCEGRGFNVDRTMLDDPS